MANKRTCSSCRHYRDQHGSFGYCDKYHMPQRIGRGKGCHKWRRARNGDGGWMRAIVAIAIMAIALVALACTGLECMRLFAAFALALFAFACVGC